MNETTNSLEDALMNIEMIKNHGANHMVDIEKANSNSSVTDSRMKTSQLGYSLDITGKVMENAAYGKEELKSAADIVSKASSTNVKLQRNYAAVMSNSMSASDFAKLTEDGINPCNTDVEESVTNLDKIKIKLAEAGITIVGYNDDLTSEEISAVVGNAGLAEGIVGALNQADIPDTKENVEAMEEVMAISTQLAPLTDEAMKYMLVNDLEPTVENIYKAEFSSGTDYFADNSVKEAAWEDIKDQVIDIAKQSEVDDDEAVAEAKWLVEHDVPLTTETVKAYDELKKITLPVDRDELLKSMTAAMADGKQPKEAILNETENLYEKAVRIADDFAKLEDGGDIRRRRQLEEVRLVMTAEANLTLLRKGINIETQPLEELVNKLKEAEKEFYRPLLLEEDSEEAALPLSDEVSKELSDKIEIYKATRSVIDELPRIPVKAVADVAVNDTENDFNLGKVSEAGEALRNEYIRAGQSYETLMTAPRADMGDSMRKAFANVDDILNDLDIDVNDTNRKAVRTLGYAQMEITKESIENIRQATNAVRSVIELMTPAKTLQMIRQGHNPLNENIYELERQLKDEPIEESAEKYSRFLWKLEKNGQITEDEKSAYIGMYRLFNQIEKQDGKVIGNVLANGMELTMQNMLSASRSNRQKNLDVQIDDDFGLLEDIVSKGESISEQISKGFTEIMNTPLPKEYIGERLEDVKKASKAPSEAEEVLKSLDEPVTVENILAVSDMIALGGKQYKKLFDNNNSQSGSDTEKDGVTSEINDLLSDSDVEELLNDFNEKDSALQAYETFVDKAVNIAQRAVETAETYEDIRDWMLSYKQLGISRQSGKRQSYDIPIKTGDTITSIHLTIKSDENKAGKVTATFDSEKYGRVNAKFNMKAEGADGFIVTDSRAGLEELKATEDKLKAELNKSGIEMGSVSFVYGKNSQLPDFIANEANENGTTNRELYQIAKAFIKALS